MEKELTILEKYRLRTEVTRAFNVADLMDKKYLLDFMKRLSYAIGAPSEKTAASIFIKRYAFIAVISLYTMTVNDKKVNVSLRNIQMEEAVQGKNWLPLISLKDQNYEQWNGENRQEWRDSVYRDLFANNIYPLIEMFERTFKVSKLILWENIAVYLFWLYETELKDLPIALEDFRFLIFEAEGNLFGRYQHNPFQNYYTEKRFIDSVQEEVRIRKTCCFTYQLDSKPKRCKTCPCTHFDKNGGCFDGESICSSVRSIT
ncbi:IucA/IucC family C-terminal-domain containing protein [Neobacillus sp. K501]